MRGNLSLPGDKEKAVVSLNHDDGPFSGTHFAIDNAFMRARSQLQDEPRIVPGKVKQHEPTPDGTVARIDASGEFASSRAGLDATSTSTVAV